MTGFADITVVSGATTVTLPGGMEWIDRRQRNIVAQNIEIAANGAPIIEEFAQIGGYPVTLQARGNGHIWVPQSAVDALITLADAPLAAPMILTYNDGTVVSVRFRYDASSIAVDAAPVYVEFPQSSATPYSLTLRLIQASA
jgi:hypothetical protein